MKKKQSLSFKGVDRSGRLFFTQEFSYAVLNSKIDPMPTNRKSRRAMPKLIRRLEK